MTDVPAAVDFAIVVGNQLYDVVEQEDHAGYKHWEQASVGKEAVEVHIEAAMTVVVVVGRPEGHSWDDNFALIKVLAQALADVAAEQEHADGGAVDLQVDPMTAEDSSILGLQLVGEPVAQYKVQGFAVHNHCFLVMVGSAA